MLRYSEDIMLSLVERRARADLLFSFEKFANFVLLRYFAWFLLWNSLWNAN